MQVSLRRACARHAPHRPDQPYPPLRQPQNLNATLNLMILGAITDAGDPNCGSTFRAPFGSPPCRNGSTPLAVRTSHTVFAFVTL